MLHLALSQAMVRLSARGSLLFWQFSGVCGLVPSGCCRAPSFILPQAASLPVCCSPSMCRAYLLFSYQSVCHVSGYVSVGVWTCGRVYEGMGVGQSWALVGRCVCGRGLVHGWGWACLGVTPLTGGGVRGHRCGRRPPSGWGCGPGRRLDVSPRFLSQ